MKKLIILAAAAIAAVACSRTFDTAPAKEQAIGFGTWAETLTKATVENTFDVNDHIGVFGVKTKSATNTTVFNNVEMFHTVFWLYALFPFTWVLATICNTIAILITLPKDLRKLDDSIKREPQILQEQ